MGISEIRRTNDKIIESQLDNVGQVKSQDNGGKSLFEKLRQHIGPAFATLLVLQESSRIRGVEGSTPEASSTALALRGDNAMGLPPAFIPDQRAGIIGRSSTELYVPPKGFSSYQGPPVQEIWPNLYEQMVKASEEKEQASKKEMPSGQLEQSRSKETEPLKLSKEDISSLQSFVHSLERNKAARRGFRKLMADKGAVDGMRNLMQDEEFRKHALSEMRNEKSVEQSISLLEGMDSLQSFAHSLEQNKAAQRGFRKLLRDKGAMEGMKILMQDEEFRKRALSELKDEKSVKQAISLLEDYTSNSTGYSVDVGKLAECIVITHMILFVCACGCEPCKRHLRGCNEDCTTLSQGIVCCPELAVTCCACGVGCLCLGGCLDTFLCCYDGDFDKCGEEVSSCVPRWVSLPGRCVGASYDAVGNCISGANRNAVANCVGAGARGVGAGVRGVGDCAGAGVRGVGDCVGAGVRGVGDCVGAGIRGVGDCVESILQRLEQQRQPMQPSPIERPMPILRPLPIERPTPSVRPSLIERPMPPAPPLPIDNPVPPVRPSPIERPTPPSPEPSVSVSLMPLSLEELQKMIESTQEEYQRIQSPLEVEVRRGQEQRIQRLQEILQTNNEAEAILVPRYLLSRVLQDEQKLQRETQVSERQEQRTQQLEEILQANNGAEAIQISTDFLEEIMQDEQMLWGVWKNNKEQIEMKMEKLNNKLKELQTSSSQDEGQIRADERRKVEDELWRQWEKQRREELQEKLQSIGRELQEKQRDMQSYRENLQSLQNSPIDRTALKELQQHMYKLRAEEQRLQGKITVVRNDLEGLPREQLRWKIRQRVDEVLSRQLSPDQLRHQAIELHESVISDFSELEPQRDILAAEFQTIFQERWPRHNHPDQELRIILGILTGIGPEH